MNGVERASEEARDVPAFGRRLSEHGREALERSELTTLQVNVGKLCNMACHHCHVDAGPGRKEIMDLPVVERVLELLARAPHVDTVDLTGGAPELNPSFRHVVRESRALGRRVLDRCNLTVLFEPGQDDLAEFLADHQVQIVASLHCYSAENVEKQRGRGAFGKSVEALRRLNALGYGQPGSGLTLDLVYNPIGPSLPPSQGALEADYREELGRLFGIRFDHLLTLANMPIKRFGRMLRRTGRLSEYMSLLVNHFNPATVDGLMCRNLVSVSWDGRLYDCDFNQMLELPLANRPTTIWDIDALDELIGLEIATERHCYGCTAGAGSSCSGALR